MHHTPSNGIELTDTHTQEISCAPHTFKHFHASFTVATRTSATRTHNRTMTTRAHAHTIA